jgi:hypothetical protein
MLLEDAVSWIIAVANVAELQGQFSVPKLLRLLTHMIVAELVIPSITTAFLCHVAPVAELMLARCLDCSDLDCAHDCATFNYQWYTCEKYDNFDLGAFCPSGFPKSDYLL